MTQTEAIERAEAYEAQTVTDYHYQQTGVINYESVWIE